MEAAEKLNTHQKALRINLDPASYGSFAEIGAGQEVVRWFLLVGGASGTVAKSISAYDKEVSDDLYGSSARYVSRERLHAMLESEWAQIVKQLADSRGAHTCFFSFVDTISARNYAGTNVPHGWIGLRFQLQPSGEPNQIILHINMRDTSNVLEQEAIGILGVNLIYAVFYQLQSRESFLENLAQGIENRIEIDYADISGPVFQGWDQRALLTELVRSGLAEAVCFPAGRSPEPPIEVLHKRDVVLAPGTFEHSDARHAAIHEEMLAAGTRQLAGELGQDGARPAGFFCFSVTPLWEGGPAPHTSDLLKRFEALHARGGDILLFRERELYAMTDLVNRYTDKRVRFVLGLSLLIRVWAYRYTKLAGSFLEALSRLLARNVRIYAYPMTAKDLEDALRNIPAEGWKWTSTRGWVSAHELQPVPPLNHLFSYVIASEVLVPIEAGESAVALHGASDAIAESRAGRQ